MSNIFKKFKFGLRLTLVSAYLFFPPGGRCTDLLLRPRRCDDDVEVSLAFDYLPHPPPTGRTRESKQRHLFALALVSAISCLHLSFLFAFILNLHTLHTHHTTHTPHTTLHTTMMFRSATILAFLAVSVGAFTSPITTTTTTTTRLSTSSSSSSSTRSISSSTIRMAAAVGGGGGGSKNPLSKLPWNAERERQKASRRLKQERNALHRQLGIAEDATYEEIVAATDALIAKAGSDLKAKVKIEIAKDKILQIRLNERLSGLATGTKDARAQSRFEQRG